MKNHYIPLIFAIFAIFCSCEREIDFKYHEIEPLTVIEAELTPEGARVGITLTTPMGELMNTTRLTDASVILTDLTTSAVFALEADNDGFFTDPTPGIAGHLYRLTVERNGQTYEAETTMYPPTEILGLAFSWIDMPYDKVAVFQAQYLDDPSVSGNCYWVKLYKNDKIYLWNESDDRGAFEGIVTFMAMTTRMDIDEEDEDTLLLDGDVMTFTVCQISRTMHDYLEALQNDSSGPALFTGPRVLGYFLASSPVSAQITFTR